MIFDECPICNGIAVLIVLKTCRHSSFLLMHLLAQDFFYDFIGGATIALICLVGFSGMRVREASSCNFPVVLSGADAGPCCHCNDEGHSRKDVLSNPHLALNWAACPVQPCWGVASIHASDGAKHMSIWHCQVQRLPLYPCTCGIGRTLLCLRASLCLRNAGDFTTCLNFIRRA